MRIASWVLIVCALLAALGLFLPCLEIRISGALLSKRTTLSLYSAGKHEDTVRRLLAAYRGSSHRQIGGQVITALGNKAHGRIKDALGDAHDAMDTLDGVTDDDVKLAGTALTATVWTFLGLAVLLMAVVFAETMRGNYRRGRLIIALALSVLIAAIGVGLCIACREVAWEANDEFGGNPVTVAFAAYMLPVASLGTLASAIVLLVRRGRERVSLTPL